LNWSNQIFSCTARKFVAIILMPAKDATTKEESLQAQDCRRKRCMHFWNRFYSFHFKFGLCLLQLVC
jgi:hypothetical protein